MKPQFMHRLYQQLQDQYLLSSTGKRQCLVSEIPWTGVTKLGSQGEKQSTGLETAQPPPGVENTPFI